MLFAKIPIFIFYYFRFLDGHTIFSMNTLHHEFYGFQIRHPTYYVIYPVDILVSSPDRIAEELQRETNERND